MKSKNATGLIVPLLSILLAFIIGGIIMAALGANPLEAMQYLIKGSFGTVNALGNTLNKATPLIFCGLCACFAYKCGVFNLGGEGQFLCGAMTACVVALLLGEKGIEGWLVCLLCLVLGTIAGGIWGFIPGILKITRGQNEMIISIMLFLRKMFTTVATIRPMSAISRMLPKRERSVLVTLPTRAIAPKVPAVMKKVVAMLEAV